MKRKAEGDTVCPPNKVPRRDVPSATSRSAANAATKPNVTPSMGGTGFQGTARPNSTGPQAAKPPPVTTKTPANGPLSGAPATGPPPKKGSFAEIMARAKVAQQSAPALGSIKHKPIEKLSRKERLAKEQEEAKKKKPDTKDARPGLARRSRSPEKGKAAPGVTQKPKRAPVDLGYKGTMRPSVNTSTYKGTMRPSGDPSRGSASRSPAPAASKPKEKVRMAGYASYSEHSDDEGSDGWDDDSDMEAGAFDLEEEEDFSLRQARRDDADELKMENELKRKKLERKSMASRR